MDGSRKEMRLSGEPLDWEWLGRVQDRAIHTTGKDTHLHLEQGQARLKTLPQTHKLHVGEAGITEILFLRKQEKGGFIFIFLLLFLFFR